MDRGLLHGIPIGVKDILATIDRLLASLERRVPVQTVVHLFHDVAGHATSLERVPGVHLRDGAT